MSASGWLLNSALLIAYMAGDAAGVLHGPTAYVVGFLGCFTASMMAFKAMRMNVAELARRS